MTIWTCIWRTHATEEVTVLNYLNQLLFIPLQNALATLRSATLPVLRTYTYTCTLCTGGSAGSQRQM